ncbi:unnamed protein product [Microthlaspi erraticum]|uniref:RNase H type-1 domain-containing protein n=1 Tax=Microthlaspi erraticum TaxID=1685480 RepID=A0A6D2HF14_9BRAS|nr:unnamed protein product [Microthlaspi erraticum]
MCTNPNSLLAKVFKGRYFPQCSPLEARLGSRPSFDWSSIHIAQGLMRQGMRRNFGAGPNDWDSDEWKWQNIQTLFAEEDVALIGQIKPARGTKDGGFSWIHNNDGAYTVKYGYWIWSHKINPESITQQHDAAPSLNPIYQAVWKTNTSPRIQGFMWRALANCLAVAHNMSKKRLTKCKQCPRCGAEDEDVNHVLFTCPYARLVWALSPLAFLFYPTPSSSVYTNMANLLLHVNEMKDDEISMRLFYGPGSYGEFGRQEMTFASRGNRPGRIKLQKQLYKTLWSGRRIRRQSPRLHQLAKGSSTCSVAWILRDDARNGRWYGAKTYSSLISSLEAEAAALTWAMAVVDNLGFEEVVFESDSRSLIQAIAHPASWPRLQCYIDDITGGRRFLKATFTTCRREANGIADCIAKSSLSKPLYSAILDCSIPAWLSPMLEKEKPCVTL